MKLKAFTALLNDAAETLGDVHVRAGVYHDSTAVTGVWVQKDPLTNKDVLVIATNRPG